MGYDLEMAQDEPCIEFSLKLPHSQAEFTSEWSLPFTHEGYQFYLTRQGEICATSSQAGAWMGSDMAITIIQTVVDKGKQVLEAYFAQLPEPAAGAFHADLSRYCNMFCHPQCGRILIEHKPLALDFFDWERLLTWSELAQVKPPFGESDFTKCAEQWWDARLNAWELDHGAQG